VVSIKILSGSFTEFFTEVEPRLRHALVAALGTELGRDAAAEALAYGWEHWDELQQMRNPAGYLYKVGRSRSRRLRRQPPLLPPMQPDRIPEVEPGLPAALARLSERQRVIVVLVHSLGWSQTDVAELLGVSLGTVHTHLTRAMKRLRSELGVES
jgi:RNA polymerase sigma-70 factor (ECF subfamily)